MMQPVCLWVLYVWNKEKWDKTKKVSLHGSDSFLTSSNNAYMSAAAASNFCMNTLGVGAALQQPVWRISLRPEELNCGESENIEL